MRDAHVFVSIIGENALFVPFVARSGCYSENSDKIKNDGKHVEQIMWDL